MISGVRSSARFAARRCPSRTVTRTIAGSSISAQRSVAMIGRNNVVRGPLLLPLLLEQQQNQHHHPVTQQRRSVFIQISDTPNPESLKFVTNGLAILDEEISGTNGYFVRRSSPSEEILRSPLAKKLFDIEGIKAVYLGSDFVTVTKYAENKWNILQPRIFSAIMDWSKTSKPALMDQAEITDTTILDDDDEVVAMIKELIEARIRPAVQEDGGDIRYVDFDEESGVVTVKLAGSCVGCPSSSVTLKQGVENMLMHYIPEVTGVVSLEEEVEDDDQNNEEGKVDEAARKQKSYEERLAASGIPFSD